MYQQTYAYPVHNVSKVHSDLGFGIFVPGSNILFSTGIVETEDKCKAYVKLCPSWFLNNNLVRESICVS